MRVTISRATTPDDPVLTLVDGPDWLNSWPIRGEVWGLEKEGLDDGWYSSAEPRIESMPDRPGVDGTFWPEESLLTSRTVPIRGFHSVDGHGLGSGSTLSVAQARDLIASFAGTAVRVIVEDAAGLREVTGYVSARPMVRRINERQTAFSIIVTCPDPLKYGPAVEYQRPSGTGVLELENVGTGDVAFTVSAATRIRSLSVRHAGRTVSWAGDSVGLLLDLADGRPLAPNGSETGYLVSADDIRVPPGRHPVTITADAPVTVTLRPGWK